MNPPGPEKNCCTSSASIGRRSTTAEVLAACLRNSPFKTRQQLGLVHRVVAAQEHRHGLQLVNLFPGSAGRAPRTVAM